MGLLSATKKPWALTALRVIVSAAFISVIILAAWKTKGKWDLAWGGWHWLALGALPALAMLACKAVKWRLVLSGLAPELTVYQCLRSYLGGVPLSAVTPGRLGELSRIAFLPRPELMGPKGMIAVFADKLTDLAALLWWLALGLWIAGFSFWSALSALAALAATPAWLWLSLAPRIAARLPAPKAWRDKIGSWMPEAGAYPKTAMLGSVLWGIASFGIEWVQYWAFFRLLAPEAALGFDAALAAMSVVTLAGVMQISFAGLGVREGLAAYLLWNSLPPAASALGAFCVFICNVALPGACGLLLKPDFSLQGRKGDPGENSVP